MREPTSPELRGFPRGAFLGDIETERFTRCAGICVLHVMDFTGCSLEGSPAERHWGLPLHLEYDEPSGCPLPHCRTGYACRSLLRAAAHQKPKWLPSLSRSLSSARCSSFPLFSGSWHSTCDRQAHPTQRSGRARPQPTTGSVSQTSPFIVSIRAVSSQPTTLPNAVIVANKRIVSNHFHPHITAPE